MQNMLAQQNRDLEALERRARERARGMAPVPGGGMGVPGGAGMQQQQRQAVAGPRMDDDDDADEIEQISTRSLALTRYKRNHELMNEVFQFAAFGDPTTKTTNPTDAVKTPYSIFAVSEMEEKMAKLNAEIEQLKSARAAAVASRCTSFLPEMMGGLSEGPNGVLMMQQTGAVDVSVNGMVVV
jgi:uncharacterized small protein (DUF1192 family)